MFKLSKVKGDDYLFCLNLSGASFVVNFTKNRDNLEYLVTNYKTIENVLISGKLCLYKSSPSSFILVNLENDTSIKLNLTEMSELRALVRR